MGTFREWDAQWSLHKALTPGDVRHRVRNVLTIRIIHPAVRNDGYSGSLSDVTNLDRCGHATDPAHIGLKIVHYSVGCRLKERKRCVPVLTGGKSLPRKPLT